MHISMPRRVDRMLTTLKSFGKKSGNCLPDDIPHGYLAVYVGNERKRFVISTSYLNHEIFKELLKRSEEELSFDHKGGLTIACEPVVFEHVLWLLGTNSSTATTTHLQELIDCHAF
jgi:hypothetical protein